MKRIDALWQSYRTLIPADADATQIIETRRAFYAGAQALFHAILSELDASPEPTDEDLKKMDEIHEELLEFAVHVRNGVA